MARRQRRPREVTPERWVAYRTIHRTFSDDAWAHLVLPTEVERFELDARQRSQAQHLAFGTIRLAARLDYVLAQAGDRPLAKLDPEVLSILRLGAFELLESDGSPAHAVVDQAVHMVRGTVGERAVGFTNAVLRRVQVDGAKILAQLDPADPLQRATLASIPAWIMQRALRDHGELGALALEALAGPPPAEAWWSTGDALTDLGGEAAPAPFNALLPLARVGTTSSSGLHAAAQDGSLVVQSLASQLCAAALEVESAQAVLDMCAAPGGKTIALGRRMSSSATLVAGELHPARAERLEARIAPLIGRGALPTDTRVVAGDALEIDAVELLGDTSSRFDAVLLDAPCSGLGVLHRRPDSRWRRSEADIASLVDLQRRLVRAACNLSRPGAHIVYSVCTTTRAEAEDIIEWALAELPFETDPWDECPSSLTVGAGAVRTWPHQHGTDGFFIQRLRRQ